MADLVTTKETTEESEAQQPDQPNTILVEEEEECAVPDVTFEQLVTKKNGE